MKDTRKIEFTSRYVKADKDNDDLTIDIDESKISNEEYRVKAGMKASTTFAGIIK